MTMMVMMMYDRCHEDEDHDHCHHGGDDHGDFDKYDDGNDGDDDYDDDDDHNLGKVMKNKAEYIYIYMARPPG